jgi:hypothetical protein
MKWEMITLVELCRDMTVKSFLYGSETWVMKDTNKRDLKQVKWDFLEISMDMEEQTEEKKKKGIRQ